MTNFDAVIIGAGPAGSATALQLATLTPQRVQKVLLVDKHHFPRNKLCGGGIVRRSEEFLSALGVRFDLPEARVDQLRVLTPAGERSIDRPGAFRVVRRELFDDALVQEVRRRGVIVREGDRIVSLEVHKNEVELRFKSGEVCTSRIVVGADGARSLVRAYLSKRHVVQRSRSARFVALEALTAGHLGHGHEALFDFSPIQHGIRGYAWAFPCWIDGAPAMNRGIAAMGRPKSGSLRTVFADVLGEQGVDLDGLHLEGEGAPIYTPKLPAGGERLLLAGDAIGVEPFLGEGISGALGSGILAAWTAHQALESNSFDFTDFSKRLETSRLGREMASAQTIADRFYSASLSVKPLGNSVWD